MDSAVWIDGRMVDPPDATIAVDDHGLTVGDGVFEVLLIVDHGSRAAFATNRHLTRLGRSCAALGIEPAHTDYEIREAIDQCVAAAPGASVVRVTVTSGRGDLSSRRGDGPASTIVVAGGRDTEWETGTKIVVFPHPRNERGALAGVKSTSYAENAIAAHYAADRNASEAIFANIRGHVCEGTGTNIFWLEGERIHTPPLTTGCLAGITRELLLELADVTESNLTIDSLPDVSEAFLTSTTRVVQSIGMVDDQPLAVVDGPATKAAAEALADLMASDIDP